MHFYIEQYELFAKNDVFLKLYTILLKIPFLHLLSSIKNKANSYLIDVVRRRIGHMLTVMPTRKNTLLF